MNCVEAQKHFADLLDHSRDERLRKVNDHLAACARCRQELAAVAACQRLVSALPPVEPPAGFSSRIMAEVRDAADHRPTVWQRLFLPVQSTLPLQATAVILISVLAVFLYQKESGQRQSATTVRPPNGVQKQTEADKSLSVASGAPALESEVKKPGASGAQGRQQNASSRSKQLRSPAKPEEQNNIIGSIEPNARKAAPPPASLNPAKVAPSKPKEESSPADETGSVRQEQSLRSGGAQAKGVPQSAPPRDNDTAAQTRSSAAESSAPAAPEETRAASSLDALSSSTSVFSNHELILRLKYPARNDRNTGMPSELERPHAEASPSQAQFKDLDQGRRRAIETGQPQTVWAMIDATQYNEFKKELARLGKIESEVPTPAHKNEVKPEDQLRIKLTILPPLPSADALPTQPSSR